MQATHPKWGKEEKMNSYLLELKNISYSYHSLHGETKALDNISFGVKEGEFVAIVGPSGCGKTTLFRMLIGEEGTDGGAVIRSKVISHFPVSF